MAVLIDLICSKCDAEVLDGWSSQIGSRCSKCKRGRLERLWTITAPQNADTNEREKCVVYISQKEGGRVQYPGRNDVPVPPRLVARGYEKVSMNPRQLAAFEKKHNVVNHARHYDRGSGRSYDGS